MGIFSLGSRGRACVCPEGLVLRLGDVGCALVVQVFGLLFGRVGRLFSKRFTVVRLL